jgi:hypothetical protein
MVGTHMSHRPAQIPAARNPLLLAARGERGHHPLVLPGAALLARGLAEQLRGEKRSWLHPPTIGSPTKEGMSPIRPTLGQGAQARGWGGWREVRSGGRRMWEGTGGGGRGSPPVRLRLTGGEIKDGLAAGL